MNTYESINYFQNIFEKPEHKIVILEITITKGQLIIDFDQEIYYGVILKHENSEVDDDMQYIFVQSEKPKRLNIVMGSESAEFTAMMILFKPEVLQTESLKAQIEFTNDFKYSGDNAVYWEDLNDSKVSMTSIVIYSLIGLGGLIFIICLILLICCLKNELKNTPSKNKKTNSINQSPKIIESQESNNVIISTKNLQNFPPSTA